MTYFVDKDWKNIITKIPPTNTQPQWSSDVVTPLQELEKWELSPARKPLPIGEDVLRGEPFSAKLKRMFSGGIENPFATTASELAAEPFWSQALMAIPPLGLAGKGITGGARVAQKLLPVGVTKTPLVVPDTSVAIGNLIDTAERAIKSTKVLRKAERARRVGKGFQTLEETGELGKAMGALKGEMPQAGLIVKATENDLKLMLDSVNQAVINNTVRFFEGINARTGLLKIFQGQVPEKSELKQLKLIFGEDIGKLVDKISNVPPSKWDEAMEWMNLPRQLLLGFFDLSSTLLQQGKMVARHPVTWGRNVPRAFKGALREKWDRVLEDGMRSHPLFNEVVDKMDLYVAPPAWQMSKVAAREEIFYARKLQKIPILGYPFRFSERGFITGTNLLRWGVAKQNYEIMKKMGAADWEHKQMGHLINELTGRGTANSKVSAVMPLVSFFALAPRLYLSKMQVPRHLVSRSKAVRQETWSTLASYMAARVAILSLLSAAGVGTVELDRRSADVGKLKVGNTRYDVWTGDLQWIRFAAQMIEGKRKAANGEIVEANRLDNLIRFGRTKLNPSVAFVTDLMAGSTIIGEELEFTAASIGKQAFNRLVGITVQDMVDAWQKQSALQGVIGGTSGFFGLGVMTYEPKQAKKAKKEIDWSVFGKQTQPEEKKPIKGGIDWSVFESK